MIANVPSTMTNAKQHNAVDSVTMARVIVLLDGTRWAFASIKYAPSLRTGSLAVIAACKRKS